MGTAKLSPPMLRLLREIANPDEADEPFPAQRTINALLRRGLIQEWRDMDDMMCRAFGCVKLLATDAGRAALAAIDGEK